MTIKNQQKQKVLVIGGSGYIGSEFCNFLLNKNLQVDCVDNGIYENNFSIRKLKKFKNFKFYNKDLRRLKIKKSYKNVVVFAGLVGDPITKKYPLLSKSINYFGIKNIINQFKNENVKFIFISTCSNYGFKKNVIAKEETSLNPKSLYAEQKVSIEKYILSLKNKSTFEPVILRFATAFGNSKRPRFDLTVNEFVLNAFLNKRIDIYDHLTWRPYCHVKDFCKVIYKVLKFKKKLNFEIFNVGSNNNNMRKIDIVKKIKKHLPNFKFEIIKSSKDPRNYKVNFNKIKNKLNIKSFSTIDYGIREMIKYLRKNKNNSKLLISGNYLIKK